MVYFGWINKCFFRCVHCFLFVLAFYLDNGGLIIFGTLSILRSKFIFFSPSLSLVDALDSFFYISITLICYDIFDRASLCEL